MNNLKKAILAIEKYLGLKQKERLVVLFEKLADEKDEKILREIDFILEEAESKAIEGILEADQKKVEKIEREYEEKVKQILDKGRTRINQLFVFFRG